MSRRNAGCPDETRKFWFLLIKLPGDGAGSKPTAYALGPAGSWSRARELSDAWERQHGPNTAAVRYRVPKRYRFGAVHLNRS